jgi:hypothetical protein
VRASGHSCSARSTNLRIPAVVGCPIDVWLRRHAPAGNAIAAVDGTAGAVYVVTGEDG